MLQTAARTQSLTLNVVARSNTEHTGVAGVVTLKAPPGWQIEPAAIELAMDSVGDARTLQFIATIPPGAEAGEHMLHYNVCVESREYSVLLDSVRMGAPGLPQPPDEATCIKEAFITRPAQVVVQLLDVTFAPGLKYAYVKGTADAVLSTLSQFGLDVHPISDHEMGFIALSRFDAVVIGPNAYLVRDELRKNAARFLEYVEQGGTLVVQYQGYGYQEGAFAPYAFRYHQPHDRVTYEDAPVTLLQPDHPLFNQPNKLGAADFEGWVMERGLYFFGEWDRRYVPLLACHDPGEEAKPGGMLIAGYGRGTYVYAAYSFFRQLPAGVPGALRLLANLLALPAAHTSGR